MRLYINILNSRDWHYILVELLAVTYWKLDHMGEFFFKDMSFGVMRKEEIYEYAEMNKKKSAKD